VPDRPGHQYRHRFPAAIIAHAVWLYHRFALSLRDVEELLYERGVDVTYETVRAWVAKFGARYAAELQRRAARPGRAWHLDEIEPPRLWRRRCPLSPNSRGVPQLLDKEHQERVRLHHIAVRGSETPGIPAR
jgi:hypothetical protein